MPWLDIGDRRTFFPPFVNERFDGPPYWACTFTSLLNAANVAKFGRIPATQAEVLALAKTSGDDDYRGGSRTSHMITAARDRYGLALRTEDVADAEIARRLASGWVLVGGCNYGQLPTSYRRWSPSFTGGHRVVLIGWSAGRTRILDPMAAAPASYTGEWIEWTDFKPAFWRDDQAWVLEGELMQQTITVLATFAPPRTFAIPSGSTIQAYTPTALGKRGTFATSSSAHFDQAVTIAQSPDPRLVPHGGPYVRVVDGVFAGQYILASQLRDPDGTALDVSPPAAAPPVDVAKIELAARQAEYDRITAGTTVVHPAPTVTWPARPV